VSQFSTIPVWVGVGVVTPFVGVVGGVGVWLVLDTQTYTPAHKPEQSRFTRGFQFTNWVNEIPFAAAMLAQPCPGSAK
jgi:hypothetical protein